MIARWGLLVVGLLVLLIAVVGVVTTYDEPAAGSAAWVSSPTDPSRQLLRVEEQPERPVTATVTVDPEDRRQFWRGTGAAMTDASVQLLSHAPDGIERLFDPGAEDGARLSWVRLPLTSTDMSPTAWTWGWNGKVASPSPQAEAAIAQVRKAADVQPALRVVATPWTAPEWMKLPRGVRGGALRSDEEDQYAAMLVAQADALHDAGIEVDAMTLGNEPGWSADYPSMNLTDQQQSRLATQVGERLGSRGVELWAVDHNWADRPRYDAVLAGAPDAFDAAAFHCYEGQPAQMAGLPVAPIVTECTGTTSTWRQAFAWDARNLVRSSIDAGSTGLMMWNLAVDATGGPRDRSSSDGCHDCRGLLQVVGDRVEPGPEFYVLAQLQRAADPGARVIGLHTPAGISGAAFANPDGTIGVFAHNGTGADRVLGIDLPGKKELRYDVRAGELVSVRTRP